MIDWVSVVNNLAACKNKMEDEVIANLAADYVLSTDITKLKTVFKHLRLLPYLEGWLKTRQVNEMSKDSLENKTYFLACSSIMSFYEGSLHCKLTQQETRAGILYLLFNVFNKSKNIITSIDDVEKCISDKKRVNLDTHVLIERLQRKTKDVKHILNVIADASVMCFYNQEFNSSHFAILYNSYVMTIKNGRFDRLLDCDHSRCFFDFCKKLSTMTWLTPWGKFKAFKLNWPRIINKTIEDAKKLDDLFSDESTKIFLSTYSIVNK